MLYYVYFVVINIIIKKLTLPPPLSLTLPPTAPTLTRTAPTAVIVHGADIEEMNGDDWDLLLTKEQIVFARTSPEQKLVIVKKFTEKGNFIESLISNLLK